MEVGKSKKSSKGSRSIWFAVIRSLKASLISAQLIVYVNDCPKDKDFPALSRSCLFLSSLFFSFAFYFIPQTLIFRSFFLNALSLTQRKSPQKVTVEQNKTTIAHKVCLSIFILFKHLSSSQTSKHNPDLVKLLSLLQQKLSHWLSQSQTCPSDFYSA